MTCDTNIPINKRMDLASDQVELKKKKSHICIHFEPDWPVRDLYDG